jgi:hypothetical protein
MKYLLLFLIAATAHGQAIYESLLIFNSFPGCDSNRTWGANSSSAINMQFDAYFFTSNTLPYSLLLCRVDCYLKRTGASGSAGTLYLQIRTNNPAANTPSNVLYAAINSVSSAEIGTADQWITFNFNDVLIPAHQVFWWGVFSSNNNSTNYHTPRIGPFGTGVIATSNNGNSWAKLSREWFQSIWARGSVIPVVSNSFEALVDFESGTNEQPVSTLILSNSFHGTDALALSSTATNGVSVFSIRSNYNITLPTNYWYLNTNTQPGGGRVLAISMADTASQHSQWILNRGMSNFCFGYYAVIGLTNYTGNPLYYDDFYFEGTSNSVCPLLTITNGVYFWRLHGLSNNVTINASAILGTAVGETNWITCQVTPTNATVALYNPFTLAQIGTNSTWNMGNDSYNKFRFLNWMHGESQAGTTNFFDNLVISTNAADFPIIPTNFPTRVHF